MKKEAARNHTRSTDFKTNYYVDGNTVRRLEGEPEERRRRQLEKEQELCRRKHRHAAKRNQERAMRMNLGYVLFCTVALILTCGVAVTYIQLQSEITGKMRRISRLETQVADLRADNDAAMKRIDLSTDLDKIKEQALGFGMTYATSDQIIYYDIEDNDYMNQYSDIPKR